MITQTTVFWLDFLLGEWQLLIITLIYIAWKGSHWKGSGTDTLTLNILIFITAIISNGWVMVWVKSLVASAQILTSSLQLSWQCHFNCKYFIINFDKLLSIVWGGAKFFMEELESDNVINIHKSEPFFKKLQEFQRPKGTDLWIILHGEIMVRFP